MSRIALMEDIRLVWLAASDEAGCEPVRPGGCENSACQDFALAGHATQSSVCTFSRFAERDLDAGGAIRGEVAADYAFHTDLELYPWWQVDLGHDVRVRIIKIYNRVEGCERLRHFTILTAEEDGSFRAVFRKLNNEDFGRDGGAFEVAFSEPLVARVVRLRADAYTHLHLRKLEVWGSAASEDDRAAHSLAREVGSQRARTHAAGRAGRVYDVGGFGIFGDADRYSASIISALERGDYEGREREIARAVLRKGDRVLEVGGAVGAVAMTCAAIVGAEAVRTIDANPLIVSDAERNFSANGLSAISASAAVLVPAASRKNWNDTVEFFISQDFWSSRLDASLNDRDICSSVQVPVAILEDEINAHEASVLFVDIEGGEVDLLLTARLERIERLVLETHYWAVGKPRTAELIRRLIETGFEMDLDLSRHHVSYFEKRASVATPRGSAARRFRSLLSGRFHV